MAGTSMDFATVIVTVIPKTSSFPPVVFTAETFFNEEEFLSEPQPQNDRARPFMANDGLTVQYIDKFAKNGKRDLTIFDSLQSDLLTHMANSNPQPMFDLSFVYQRNDQLSSEIRTHMHRDCKFMNHPMRAMSHDISTVKFNFHYANLELLGPTGVPV